MRGINYMPSEENHNWLIDLQAERRKQGKKKVGLARLIDIKLTEQRKGEKNGKEIDHSG